MKARRFKHRCYVHVLVLGLLAVPVVSVASTLPAGSPFDPGQEMTQPAAGAPPEIAKVGYLLGDWEVTQKNFRADGTAQEVSGAARWTLMNRGHGFMEVLHLDPLRAAVEPLGFDSMAFLTFNPGAKTWVLGQGDSWSESIEVFNGDSEGEALVLYSVMRRLGGVQVTFRRLRLQSLADGLGLRMEQAERPTGPWTTVLERQYRPSNRDSATEGSAAGSSEADRFGAGALGRPDEASQFDFLIGEWDALQDITFPNGQQAKFPSRTTAVFALQGRAVLEFNWFDIDPALPDAATSILRLYNRAMRRWESLYYSNRGQGMLYFGGRQEGDRMVLHQFGAHTGDIPMARYIFHSIEADAYRWFTESSTDRGETFTTTWTIDVARRKPIVADAE